MKTERGEKDQDRGRKETKNEMTKTDGDRKSERWEEKETKMRRKRLREEQGQGSTVKEKERNGDPARESDREEASEKTQDRDRQRKKCKRPNQRGETLRGADRARSHPTAA